MAPVPIAFFDLDGTLVIGQTQQLFVSFLRSRGEVALPYLAGVGLWFAAYKLGLVRPTDSLRERGARLLQDRSQAEVRSLMQEFMDQVLAPRLHPGAVSAVADHRTAGHRVVILSAALEPLVVALAGRLAVTEWVATPVEVAQGRFTGRLAGPPLYGSEKVVAARRLMEESGVDPAVCAAYADHESDIDLLEVVGRPVAVHPKAGLLAEARGRGWRVLV
jgi:HAD superfamily hydrolase (TIGR01490 family)